jgi:TolB-like protein
VQGSCTAQFSSVKKVHKLSRTYACQYSMSGTVQEERVRVSATMHNRY